MAAEGHAAPNLEVMGFGCICNGRVLLRHIDVTLAGGQVLWLKGGNGAGKSTLLRSLAGLRPWRAGTMRWCGEEVQAHSSAYQQHLAYLGHQCSMSDALTGWENLRFALHMSGLAWHAAHAAAVLEQLEVCAAADRLFGRLSQGQRRRLALARVMLSAKKLWLLDEPDNALDSCGSAFLAQTLAAHAQAGGMAVVVSHRGLALPDTQTLVLDLSALQTQQAQSVQEGAC